MSDRAYVMLMIAIIVVTVFAVYGITRGSAADEQLMVFVCPDGWLAEYELDRGWGVSERYWCVSPDGSQIADGQWIEADE